MIVDSRVEWPLLFISRDGIYTPTAAACSVLSLWVSVQLCYAEDLAASFESKHNILLGSLSYPFYRTLQSLIFPMRKEA